MTAPLLNEKPRSSLPEDFLRTVLYFLVSRRGLLVLAGLVILGGLAFNWRWLVAAGIAPLLISVLPCIAMCTIGVCCLKRRTGSAGSTKTIDKNPDETDSQKQD